ncbi:hypothetical protein INR49_005024 [Caranx melampygus]|nr:hypothetical protein INR49_005024 [Caranx melampygus]
MESQYETLQSGFLSQKIHTRVFCTANVEEKGNEEQQEEEWRESVRKRGRGKGEEERERVRGREKVKDGRERKRGGVGKRRRGEMEGGDRGWEGGRERQGEIEEEERQKEKKRRTEGMTDNQMFQYFITVVPTRLNTYKISADTHQFSVTERERVINHAAGSHGVSGIFVKYDTSSLMVTVSEQHMPLWQFLVRLCGIVGGIFSTTGMLHGLVGFTVDVICCRLKLGVYRPREVVQLHEQMNNLNNHHVPLLDDPVPQE